MRPDCLDCLAPVSSATACARQLDTPVSPASFSTTATLPYHSTASPVCDFPRRGSPGVAFGAPIKATPGRVQTSAVCSSPTIYRPDTCAHLPARPLQFHLGSTTQTSHHQIARTFCVFDSHIRPCCSQTIERRQVFSRFRVSFILSQVSPFRQPHSFTPKHLDNRGAIQVGVQFRNYFFEVHDCV